MSEQSTELKLYTYWRSSAAYRVRIALNLKGLAFESLPVHLVRNGGEQHRESYLDINPQGLVPVLAHGAQVVTQSLAICEYLEECFPEPPLLPGDVHERARVRSLALQIACEIHPLNNLRVQKYLDTAVGGVDKVAWMAHWMGAGFAAVETSLAGMGNTGLTGPGGGPGLFECFLVPQVYNAERFAVDLAPFPNISRMVEQCRELAPFQEAAPESQPDAAPD